LDWALILSVLLRDAMAVLRLVSVARSMLLTSPSTPSAANPSSPNSNVETVTRLRDGLLALSHWVENESQGYRPFMTAIYGQIGVLTKLILPQKMVHSPTSPNPLPATEATMESFKVRTRTLSSSLSTPLISVDESEEITVPVMNGKPPVELLPEAPPLDIPLAVEATRKEEVTSSNDATASSCIIS
jgi:hypothetical protein